MCTAINGGGFFGRTLDLEFSYSEAAVIAPRGFEFRFLYEGANSNHSAVIGISHVSDGYPLFYDAANEAGLCVAALIPRIKCFSQPSTSQAADAAKPQH